ncbi:hypothetical protein B566_EDAN005359 [Ephemera danica]|nr:hypothetical protein B566_EDAN005359 [Ephemera danica]
MAATTLAEKQARRRNTQDFRLNFISNAHAVESISIAVKELEVVVENKTGLHVRRHCYSHSGGTCGHSNAVQTYLRLSDLPLEPALGTSLALTR